MNEIENKLKLSLYLAAKGISPNSLPTINDSYKNIKLQLKKETQLTLNISQIDLIIIELIKCSLSQDINHLDKTAAIRVYMQCMPEIKPQIELIISKEISANDYCKIIRLMVQVMTVFNVDQQKTPLSSQKFIYPMQQNNSVKLALNSLFNRALTEPEFLLIFESWFSYMYLAQDVDNNTKFTEQIAEARNSIANLIKSKRKEIKENDAVITQLKSFNNLIQINISSLESIKDQNNTHLSNYIKFAQSLKLDNGNPLCSNSLKENAYFAVLFCTELMGLSAPELNKNGNPFISVLDIMLGLSEHSIEDKADIRNRLSAIFQKYKSFKNKTQETQITVSTLIQCVRDKPGCTDTLRAAYKIYQSKLLQLNQRPSISLINKDA